MNSCRPQRRLWGMRRLWDCRGLPCSDAKECTGNPLHVEGEIFPGHVGNAKGHHGVGAKQRRPPRAPRPLAVPGSQWRWPQFDGHLGSEVVSGRNAMRDAAHFVCQQRARNGIDSTQRTADGSRFPESRSAQSRPALWPP